MSFIGTTEIGKMYLGNSEIDKAYLGSVLVYKNGYDALVNYLESSGTQYINTGYIPNTTTRLILDVALTSTSSAVTMGGLVRATSGTSMQRFHISTYQNKWNFGVSSYNASGKYKNFNSPSVDTQRHTIELRGGGYCAVDSVTSSISVSNSGSYTQSIFLFARNLYQNSVDDYASMRLYGATIKENDNIIINLVPCRIGQTGYLYDTISGNMYGNIGTGSFVVGSDV